MIIILVFLQDRDNRGGPRLFSLRRNIKYQRRIALSCDSFQSNIAIDKPGRRSCFFVWEILLIHNA